jgi:hypothetical protein
MGSKGKELASQHTIEKGYVDWEKAYGSIL